MSEALKKDRERFVAFAFAAAEIFLEVTLDGEILFEGGAADRLHPKGIKSLVGQNIRSLLPAGDDDLLFSILQMIRIKGRVGPVPIRFNIGDNWHALRVFGLQMHKTSPSLYLSLRSAPISNSAEIGDSDIDPDTGLVARDAFLEITSKTMAGLDADSGNLYLTVAKIDGLEKVRARFGQAYSQVVLRKIASYLKVLSAEGTMAGQIKDDEFAIMHTGITSAQDVKDAISVADQKNILSTQTTTVAGSQAIDEGQILKTLSYILSEFSRNPENCTFSNLNEAYDKAATEAQSKIATIKSMIESNSFSINFQPIYHTLSRDVVFQEVLSRFSDILPNEQPSELIKFAEGVGVVEAFDLAVFDKSIDYIRKYKKLDTPISLSVNLSGATLANEVYMEKVIKLLDKNKDLNRKLLIELTESCVIENLERASKVIDTICSLGFEMCLDNFGSGASGLTYLRAFDIKYCKLSNKFTRDLTADKHQSDLVKNIVDLCHKQQIKMIMEHVETQDHIDSAVDLGIDYIQGFYLSKPLPSPKI